MSSEIILCHLTFALILFLLLPIGKLPMPARFAVFAGAVLLGIVPYTGLSLATYLRSLTDDLAITTLLWLGWYAAAKILRFRAMPARQQGELVLCFGALALLLYPATLGLASFDPYRLGYSPRLMFGLIFAVSIAFWWSRNYLGAAMLTLATAVFTLNIKQSDNYWDHLVDPLLGLYCWAFIASYALRLLWQKIRLRNDYTVHSVPSGTSTNIRWKPVLGGKRVRAAFSRARHPAISRSTKSAPAKKIDTLQTVSDQSLG